MADHKERTIENIEANLVRMRLEEGDVETREAHIREFGESGDPRLVEPLCALLNDLEYRIRRAAAHALGALQDTRAVVPLCAALGDWNSQVRATAATALGALGDRRSAGPLLALLSDVFVAVRIAAALALVKLGDFRGVEPLYEDLGEAGLSRHIAVIEALGQVPGARAIEALCEHLRDHAPPVDPVTDIISFPYAGGSISASIRREYAIAELPIRLAAAAALGVQGDKRAVGPLHCHLSDPNAELRRAAADTLRTLGWEPESDEDQALVAIAEMNWASSSLTRAGALGPLCARLDDPVPSIRLKAIQAIQSLNSRAALPALRSRLRWFGVHETDSVVRERLLQAIASIERSTAQFRDLPISSTGPEPDARGLPIPAPAGTDEP